MIQYVELDSNIPVNYIAVIMNREYSSFPILTVGGIIFIDGKVLLIKRNQQPGRGRWTIPGGAVHIGETVPEALQREVLEETGLSVEVKSLVEIVEKIIRDEDDKVKFHYVILDYLCEYISGEMAASSDAEDIKTVSMNELDELDLIEGTREIIEKGYIILEGKK